MTRIAHTSRLFHATLHSGRTLLARFVDAHAGWRQRQHLATLDDDRLRDLGLTRHQANVEAAKPLWNAPDQWLR
jgi:uncharacterized protein YjiS (DUF1127 family)